jgi:hypothetical protein
VTDPTPDIQDLPADGTWVHDGQGAARLDGFVIALDPDDPGRWVITDEKSGESIGGKILDEEEENGYGHGLTARLASEIGTTDGLEAWCEWAEAVAISILPTQPPTQIFDLGDPKLRRLMIAQSSYMWIDSADPTLVALATDVSSAIEDGEPLWVMLVGASSSGKGERLRIIDKTVHKRVKDLTLAGLLSTAKLGKAAGGGYKTTGLLASIEGESAVISITDFSALLSPDKSSGGAKMEIFNALRDVYDGEYTRTMYGAVARWSGRVTLVAACTSAIDQFSAHSDSLGTRWLYYRLATRGDDDRRVMAQMVARRDNLKEGRERAAEIAREIVLEARGRVAGVEIDREMETLITECALMASYGRSSVPREQYGTKHEISDMVDTEEPGRITHQLRLFARSLLALNVKREVVERIVRHAAISSMPGPRAAVLRTLAAADEPITTNAVATKTGLAWKVAYRAAEDLEAVSLAISHSEGVPGSNGEAASRSWSINPARQQGLNVAMAAAG